MRQFEIKDYKRHQTTGIYMPHIIEKTSEGEKTYDPLSRLLRDRIIMLFGQFDDDLALSITSQLLFLESEDSTKDIYMYINSPGGVVTSGLGILDTMDFVKPDVNTVCVGQAASMGAFILSAGAKGKRSSLVNSRIMIHQPLGGAQGQATDIQIQAKEIQRLKDVLNEIMGKNCGKTKEEMEILTDRDNFLSAQEAVNLGLIDTVIYRQ